MIVEEKTSRSLKKKLEFKYIVYRQLSYVQREKEKIVFLVLMYIDNI